MKKLPIFGIILAIGLIAAGIFLPVPNKEIDVWSNSSSGDGYYEYVGGDSFNIQIEASLRGGIIAGRIASKSVFISVGILLLFISIKTLIVLHSENAKLILLNRISEDLSVINNTIKQESSHIELTEKMVFDIQKDISNIKEELLSNLGEDYIIPSIDEE